jgi:hypothetical protein
MTDTDVSFGYGRADRDEMVEKTLLEVGADGTETLADPGLTGVTERE